MLWSTTKIAGLIVGLTVLSMPMVYADNGPMQHQGGMHCKVGDHHPDNERMMAKILSLSDDQVKQLKDLHQKERESMKATFEQIKTNMRAIETEIVKANPDMNKITDLENQLKAAQNQMVDNHLNTALAIKKVLTPEQFAGYMALKEEKQLKMMHHIKDRFKHGDSGKGWDGHKSWNDKDEDGD